MIEGHTRKRHLHALEFGKVGFCLEQVGAKLFFLPYVRCLVEVTFQFFDFQGHGNDFVFYPRYTSLLNVRPCRLRGNNLDAGRP